MRAAHARRLPHGKLHDDFCRTTCRRTGGYDKRICLIVLDVSLT